MLFAIGDGGLKKSRLFEAGLLKADGEDHIRTAMPNRATRKKSECS